MPNFGVHHEQVTKIQPCTAKSTGSLFMQEQRSSDFILQKLKKGNSSSSVTAVGTNRTDIAKVASLNWAMTS